MSAQQKIEQALALYWSARRLEADALRMQRPDWSEAQIEVRVREIFLPATT